MTLLNPQIPDPNAILGYVGQQVPGPLQAEYLPQGRSRVGADARGCWMQAVSRSQGLGSTPAVPARRRTSYKLAVILLVVGLLFVVSPFIAWGVIDLIPGNHGDGGDGLVLALSRHVVLPHAARPHPDPDLRPT